MLESINETERVAPETLAFLPAEIDQVIDRAEVYVMTMVHTGSAPSSG